MSICRVFPREPSGHSLSFTTDHICRLSFPLPYCIVNVWFTTHSDPEVSLGAIHSWMCFIPVSFNKAAFFFFFALFSWTGQGYACPRWTSVFLSKKKSWYQNCCVLQSMCMRFYLLINYMNLWLTILSPYLCEEQFIHFWGTLSRWCSSSSTLFCWQL